jgi:hypothetical protein
MKAETEEARKFASWVKGPSQAGLLACVHSNVENLYSIITSPPETLAGW